MPKIDFLIAGAQKGGTHALDAVLRGHPDVGMCRVKEPHFFDTEENFAATPDYDLYHRRFDMILRALVRGEATPDHLYWPASMARIGTYNPAMKLIIMLRHPVDRSYSQWTMATSRGRETLSFAEVVDHDIAQLKAGRPYQRAQKAYVARGLYGAQVRRVLQEFPNAQTWFIKSEVFRRDAKPYLVDLCDFLRIRPVVPGEQPRGFARKYSEPMDPAMRERLLGFYAKETASVETLFGWDCSDWRV